MDKMTDIQPLAYADPGKGAPPLLWGGALSLITIAFLAAMLWL